MPLTAAHYPAPAPRHMSHLHPVTQAHHLPELEDPTPRGTFDGGPHTDESDYSREYDDAALLDAAAEEGAPTDADLASDEDISAFLDASRAAFIGWLDTMGSDPHAPRPGVATVRPSAPSPVAVSR